MVVNVEDIYEKTRHVKNHDIFYEDKETQNIVVV